MKQKLYILLILLVLLLAPLYLYYYQSLKPVNPGNSEAINFSIKSGEDVRSIAQKLYDQKLIRSSLVFFLKARLTEYGKKIQAGDFLLSQSMNMQEISQELTHGTSDIRLTIPEGWRKEEIAMKITGQFDIPENEILRTAHEGYLFPDTYLIPKEATGSQIVKMMEDNFNKKIQKVREAIKQKGLDFDEAIIIASLIEREAKLPEDRPLIASVILNRLKLEMKLDVDATVQYALGYQSDEKTWWKRNLTIEDLGFESVYNTYRNSGLPPTAIANPGLSSIEAVINAPKTDYLYYIADKNGKTHFAKTIEEQDANIAKYLDR